MIETDDFNNMLLSAAQNIFYKFSFSTLPQMVHCGLPVPMDQNFQDLRTSDD